MHLIEKFKCFLQLDILVSTDNLFVIVHINFNIRGYADTLPALHVMELPGIYRAAVGSASWDSHPRMVLMWLPSLLETVTGQKYHCTSLLLSHTAVADCRPEHTFLSSLRVPPCLPMMAQKGKYPIYCYSIVKSIVSAILT